MSGDVFLPVNAGLSRNGNEALRSNVPRRFKGRQVRKRLRLGLQRRFMNGREQAESTAHQQPSNRVDHRVHQGVDVEFSPVERNTQVAVSYTHLTLPTIYSV